MASRNDFGVKVSQIGWDVNTAGDANLYFSSSWPILKINSTDTIATSLANSVINHGLTYPPLVLVWNDTDGLQPCQVTASVFTVPSILSKTSRYFVFRLPLNVPYQSDVIHSTPQPPGGIDHDFGLKFVKDGKDLSSNDYRDFTLHSSVRSPLLHAVLYDKLVVLAGQTGYSLRWIPDLPYTPLFFAYYTTDNTTFIPLSTIAQVGPKVIATITGQLTVNSGVAGRGSLILLKDPLDQVNKLSKVF